MMTTQFGWGGGLDVVEVTLFSLRDGRRTTVIIVVLKALVDNAHEVTISQK